MTVSVRGTMTNLTTGSLLPGWVRVGCLAWSRAEFDGHARFGPGDLAQALGLSVVATSKAVDLARTRGWIDPVSTARCVVLPGHGDAACEERHR